MTNKTATKKVIQNIKNGDEPKPTKRFEICAMLRCPGCGAIMVTLEESVYCTNPPCECLNVKYRIPTIVLQQK